VRTTGSSLRRRRRRLLLGSSNTVLYGNKECLKGIDASKSRDRSWDGVFRDKGHDGNHGETAIVQLTGSLGLEGIRVNIGKVNLGKDNGGQVTSHHVMRLLGFRGDFSNKNGANNLGLSCR
jgi:hypothetical protein